MDSNSKISGKTKVMEVKHIWTIKNFKSETKPGTCLVSPTFFLGGDGDLQGRLILFPQGESDEPREYASLHVSLDSVRCSTVQAHVKCYILVDQRAKVGTKRAIFTFTRNRSCSFPQFLHLDLLRKLLDDGALSIGCVVNFIGFLDDESTSFNKFLETFLRTDSAEKSVCQVNFTEKKRQQDNEFSDLTLIAAGTEFHAHQNILAAQSPVFSEMFFHKMKDIAKARVELLDVHPKVLREVLRFLYTGKIEDWTLIPSLLGVADNYKLEQLKSVCEQVLFNMMSLDNVFEVLILADQHNLKQLKAKVFEFVVLHAASIPMTAGFQKFQESKKMRLMSEAFCVLAEANGR